MLLPQIDVDLRMFQQHSDDHVLIALNRQDERCIAICILYIDVRPRLEQELPSLVIVTCASDRRKE